MMMITNDPLGMQLGIGNFELEQIKTINAGKFQTIQTPLPATPPLPAEPVFTPRVAPYNPANPLTEMLGNFSGLEHKPGARPVPWRPTPMFLLWAAPNPFGLAPPEWYGIDPNYTPNRWFKDSYRAAYGEMALEGRDLNAARRQVIESLLFSNAPLLPLTDEGLWALRRRIKELTGYYNVPYASREDLAAILRSIDEEELFRARRAAEAPNPIAIQDTNRPTMPLTESPPTRHLNPVIDRVTLPLTEAPPPPTGNPIIDRATLPITESAPAPHLNPIIGGMLTTPGM